MFKPKYTMTLQSASLNLTPAPGTPASSAKATLFRQLIDPANLLAAWARARKNKGTAGGDGVSIVKFEAHLDKNLDRLYHELENGRYRPGRLRRVSIARQDGGRRPFAIPPVRDRIAQTATLIALSPLLDRLMSETSFAYCPGRSVDMAVRQARLHVDNGLLWLVDVDIYRFFDRIQHRRLLTELTIWINDERVLIVIGLWLRTYSWHRGISQGAPISPLLANLYLHPVDRPVAAASIQAVRYADNVLVFCNSQASAKFALAYHEMLIRDRGLSLARDKTAIVHATRGINFLGQRISGHRQLRLPRQARLWHRRRHR